MEEGRRVSGLVDFIARRYGAAAEIGIGLFPDVAHALVKRGLRVFASDIRPIHYDDVEVIVDDIMDPHVSLYEGIGLIYSMRPPPELVPYMKRLSEMVRADLIIKPLASDYVEDLTPIRSEDTVFFVRSTVQPGRVPIVRRQERGVFDEKNRP